MWPPYQTGQGAAELWINDCTAHRRAHIVDTVVWDVTGKPLGTIGWE
jgi:hypothetical protein